jgi:D-alanyl-D-alanine dipeptidase
VHSIVWAALLAAAPAPPLSDVARAIPDAVIDLRYATAENAFGRAMYPAGARCLLLPAVADRLAAVAARLRADGLRLVLWDCYRPAAVQRELWGAMPRRGFVAPPVPGSVHSRGAAVDVAIVAADGGAVPLPTGFDAFEPRAWARATEGVPPAARRNRDRLRAAMMAEGFKPIRMEWWHFEAPEARGAPVLDVPLGPR